MKRVHWGIGKSQILCDDMKDSFIEVVFYEEVIIGHNIINLFSLDSGCSKEPGFKK